MFIQPFKVKTNNQMRSSDQKKLKNIITSKFPSLTEGEVELIFPSKAVISLLKVITHDQTHVNVYTMDKQPMFFKLADERLYPTLYTLWLIPNMLPCFTTHPKVLTRMTKGSDLMLPEILRLATEPEQGRLEKDDMVAVNSPENKAPVAMGVLAMSSDDLCMPDGVGPCVKIMHVFGDKLWGIEPKVCKQLPILEAALHVPKKDEFSVAGSEKLDDGAVNDIVIKVEEKSPVDITTEQDAILKNAFLAALKMNGEKIPVPIIASTFYPVHVQPFLAESVEMRHTSYKKLQNFIKQMTYEGFLVVNDGNTGVPKIMQFNFEHPEVVAFNLMLAKRPEPFQTAENVGKLLAKTTELYAVNEDTQSLFSSFNLPVGATLDPTQIKHHLKDYASRNQLPISASNQIQLDETLRRLCSTEHETIGFNHLIYIVTEKMSRPLEQKCQMATMKETNKPIIYLITVTRKWNKIVTLISNLEYHNVDIAKFVKEVKQGVAAGVSVVQTPGKSSQELQVQGDQVRYVYELLTQVYGIPGHCIARQELAKKSKRKKKLVNKVKKEMRLRRVKIRKVRRIVFFQTAGMQRNDSNTAKKDEKFPFPIGVFRRFETKTKRAVQFPFQIGGMGKNAKISKPKGKKKVKKIINRN